MRAGAWVLTGTGLILLSVIAFAAGLAAAAAAAARRRAAPDLFDGLADAFGDWPFGSGTGPPWRPPGRG